MIGGHTTTIVRLRDPYLGWRWVIECSWCGAFGRFESEADAEVVAERHREVGGFERRP